MIVMLLITNNLLGVLECKNDKRNTATFYFEITDMKDV